MLTPMSSASRNLLALSLGAIASISTLLTGTSHAYACSCVTAPLPQAVEGSTAVFEGLVTTVEEGEGTPKARRVSFKVVRLWKGDEDAEQVSVHTAADSSRCGVPFVEGKSYLVFAQGEEGALQVNACSRTRRTAEADDDLAGLGAGITPVAIKTHTAEDGVGTSEPLPKTDQGAGGCASCNVGVGGAPFPSALAVGLVLWWRRRQV